MVLRAWSGFSVTTTQSLFIVLTKLWPERRSRRRGLYSVRRDLIWDYPLPGQDQAGAIYLYTLRLAAGAPKKKI